MRLRRVLALALLLGSAACSSDEAAAQRGSLTRPRTATLGKGEYVPTRERELEVQYGPPAMPGSSDEGTGRGARR